MNFRQDRLQSKETYHRQIYIYIYIYIDEVAQLCPTLCDPMDCSLPGSSVHGIFQARILEWVAIFFSRGSSWHRDQTQVSCIVGWLFTLWATRESPVQRGTLNNTKGSILQEDIVVFKVYVSNNTTSKYMRQKLIEIELQGEIDEVTIISLSKTDPASIKSVRT